MKNKKECDNKKAVGPGEELSISRGSTLISPRSPLRRKGICRISNKRFLNLLKDEIRFIFEYIEGVQSRILDTMQKRIINRELGKAYIEDLEHSVLDFGRLYNEVQGYLISSKKSSGSSY